jgi:hypothetical protein
MESLKKNIVWYLCAIVIVLGYMVHHEYNKGVQYQKQSDTLENTISALNQKVKVSEIKLADSITAKQAEVVSLEMTNKNLQSLYGQLLQASQTKSKDIQTLVVTKTITSGTDTVLCLVDSFGGLKAHWADPYINIQVDIDSAKRAAIDYSIKDSLTIINYQKKHSILFGLIKWKSYEGCKVITHNPKATPVTVLSNSVIDN